MNGELLKNIPAWVGAAAGVWGIWVYFRNSRLRRAEWLSSLYEKFFERTELKSIREALDCEGNQSAAIDKLVSEEPAEFTDYLNFFEFVAVLRKARQLTQQEIEDLFCYYLDCLENSKQVRDYISRKGYERLDALLCNRAKRR